MNRPLLRSKFLLRAKAEIIIAKFVVGCSLLVFASATNSAFAETPILDANHWTITDFYLWCSDPVGSPVSISRTIVVMQEIVGQVGAEKCFEAQQELRGLTELDLTARGIEDLRPLSDFPLLKAIKLGGNLIVALAPLVWIRNLESLNLESNPITNLTPIAKMQSLHELNMSNTPLFNGEVLRTEENCPTNSTVTAIVRTTCAGE